MNITFQRVMDLTTTDCMSTVLTVLITYVSVYSVYVE